MALEFDPFDDILSGPDGGNARAGAKFRPKAKPQSRKETHVSVPNNLTNAVEDIPLVTTGVDEESSILSTHGDMASDSARTGGEGCTADIFFDIEDIIGDSTASNVDIVRKFQPRVKVYAGHKSKLPVSSVASEGGEKCTISDDKGSFSNASHAENPEGELGRPSPSSLDGSTLGPCNFVPTDISCEHAPQGTVNNRESGLFDYNQDFTINVAGTEGEEQTFIGLQYPNDISQTATLGETEWVPPALEYFDDDQHTAPADDDFADFTLEYPIGEEPTQSGNASGPNTSIPQEAVDSETVPMFPRKQSIRSQKRKFSTASDNNSAKIHSINNEPSQEILDRDGDNEYGEEDTTRDKKAQNGKAKITRKRKNTSAGPDVTDKEQPKKDFPHTTRRTKRQLNKTLLETPEDEIDPRKLPLKDLILLGELREQRLKKDATTAKKSAPNQSVDNSYPEDAAPYDPDDPFATMQDDLNPEETTTRPKLNYHSYMKKRPRVKWSKQDTELFYSAIRQFGTDFTMIEQLFPDLDGDPIRRRQMVKAKYKIEERKQPMRLHDALTNRSKNHSHFELVIAKLRQAEKEQNSDEDMESVGVSAEAEENIPERDEVVEKMEGGDGDMEILKLDSPVKSVHETEDDTYKWSPANSDYDEYVPY